jgi:hypothetical protein
LNISAKPLELCGAKQLGTLAKWLFYKYFEALALALAHSCKIFETALLNSSGTSEK